MTLPELLIYLAVAGLAGALGRAIAGDTRGGCLVSIALGFVGAVLGTWMARALELPAVGVIDIGGADFPLVWAIIGAAVFVAVLGLITQGSRRRRRR